MFLVGVLTGLVAFGNNLAVENIAGLKFVHSVNLMNSDRFSIIFLTLQKNPCCFFFPASVSSRIGILGFPLLVRKAEKMSFNSVCHLHCLNFFCIVSILSALSESFLHCLRSFLRFSTLSLFFVIVEV